MDVDLNIVAQEFHAAPPILSVCLSKRVFLYAQYDRNYVYSYAFLRPYVFMWMCVYNLLIENVPLRRAPPAMNRFDARNFAAVNNQQTMDFVLFLYKIDKYRARYKRAWLNFISHWHMVRALVRSPHTHTYTKTCKKIIRVCLLIAWCTPISGACRVSGKYVYVRSHLRIGILSKTITYFYFETKADSAVIFGLFN